MVRGRRMKAVDSYHFSAHAAAHYSSSPVDTSPLCSHHRTCHRQGHNYVSSQMFRMLNDAIYQSMPLPFIHGSYYRCY